MGENPPNGAIVDYVLNHPANRVVLTFYDNSRHVVRRFSSEDSAPSPISPSRQARVLGAAVLDPSTAAGMHRFAWDLREAPPSATKIARSRPSRTTPRASRKARSWFRAAIEPRRRRPRLGKHGRRRHGSARRHLERSPRGAIPTGSAPNVARESELRCRGKVAEQPPR